MQTTTTTTSVLDALEDPIRRQIVTTIAVGPHNVTQLCGVVNKRQQAVSRHLTILKLRGIARMVRVGKCNFYSLGENGSRAVAAIEAAEGRFAIEAAATAS